VFDHDPDFDVDGFVDDDDYVSDADDVVVSEQPTSYEGTGYAIAQGAAAQTENLSGGESSVSPLVTFSSATQRAAARESVKSMQRKTKIQRELDMRNDQIWQQVLDERPGDLAREQGKFGRIVAYRELAKVPIPSPLRSVVWPILLDVTGLRAREPDLFASLCARGETEELPADIEHTINADVTRTMPYHCLFWAGGAQVGIESLRRMLRAYAIYVPEVGYCQGMSSVAALLIMNSQGEEDAFLMFVRFMSRYGYRKMFLPGFPQYQEWLDELRPVVPYYFREASARLESEGIPIELYADKWLITALTHNFPHRHLLRVWDLMLLGGSPKILLKSCLAVIKLSQDQLNTLDFEGMITFLQRGFADSENGVLKADNVEEFLDIARNFRLAVLPEELAAAAAVVSITTGTRQRPTSGAVSGSNAMNHSAPPGSQPTAHAAKRSPFSACFSCFKPKED
jgi:Rab-GTPase-TBC domain